MIDVQEEMLPFLPDERPYGDRCVLVLSGGADSTISGFLMRSKGYTVHAVTFDYGQRHRKEIEAARVVAKMIGCASHEVISLGIGVLQGNSPLISGAPLAQYADYQSLPGGLEDTFVPMRNQLFLTLAANRAYVLGARVLVSGVCQEDSGGYPDCRDDFVSSFVETCNLGTFTGEPGTVDALHVFAPLMYMSKADSVHLALSLPGCYEALAFTHTSYSGEGAVTGQHDHAALLRAKGFAEAGIPDPLVLRSWVEAFDLELPPGQEYATTELRDSQFLLRVARALHAERERVRLVQLEADVYRELR